MLEIKENHSLKELTTFHIGGKARFYIPITSESEVLEAMSFIDEKKLPFYVLGGGSNVIVSDAGYEGVVLHMQLKGKEVVHEMNDIVILRGYAGENWDEFVKYACDKNLWGIENLSHIPGSMGAFAVQNVGAYGQEAKQVIHEVHCFDTKKNVYISFPNHACEFSYRSSVFNTSQKGRYIILSTDICVSKKQKAMIEYPDVQAYFKERNIMQPTIQEIRQAIITIRDAKLPNPNITGNAGSCFKNLLLGKKELQVLDAQIQKNFDKEVYSKFQEIQNKFTSENGTKIPTAFLMDICGLKGVCRGDACIHEKQPLVIVNTGGAKSEDVFDLIEYVRSVVLEKTKMRLTLEPQIIK